MTITNGRTTPPSCSTCWNWTWTKSWNLRRVSAPPSAGARSTPAEPIDRITKTMTEQQLLDKLTQDGIKIPPQPTVLIELEQQLGKSDVNIADIAALVVKDVGLSALV